jgi:hypothetical protein
MAHNSSEDTATAPPASQPAVDFALVLSRVIDSVTKDPKELRNAVYEIARVKFLREAWNRGAELDIAEVRRLGVALENAIERVEAFASRQDELRALKSLDRLIQNLERRDIISVDPPAATSALILDAGPIAKDPEARPLTVVSPRVVDHFDTWFKRNRSLCVRFSFVVICAITVSMLIYARGVPLNDSRQPTKPQSATGQNDVGATRGAKSGNGSTVSIVEVQMPPAPTEQGVSQGFPLPDHFGFYAISNGELRELNALPGRAPDQRVFMSAAITKPSQTVLADGAISFVAFRRDIMTSAPDRASIRVIARVVRAMTFANREKAKTAKMDDVWAMRNVSYDFRVAPIKDHPEMVVVRHEDPDFRLSPGRYAIVFKDIAYDFSVAGTITDVTHCLERTEAANGTFYSECREPAL